MYTMLCIRDIRDILCIRGIYAYRLISLTENSSAEWMGSIQKLGEWKQEYPKGLVWGHFFFDLHQ